VTVVAQRNFAGGMFRAAAPELIPPSGVYDLANGLVEEEGVIFRRGGAAFLTADWAGTGALATLWSGRLTNGERVVTADAANLRAYDPSTWAVAHTGAALGGYAISTRPAVYKGTLVYETGDTYDGTAFSTLGTLGAGGASGLVVAAAGRLVSASGDTVRWTGIDTWVWDASDFHRIPGGDIIGLEPIRDGVAVFTREGVWIITGLSMNLTDADGNVQHRMDYFSRDLILWRNSGIASWRGGIVVPARDGVWLMRTGITSEAEQPFERISGPIEDLYRSYVDTGVTPGVATVYRGHYFLPLQSAEDDGAVNRGTLVCRLDLPSRPWSRISGHAGNVTAFAEHSDDSAPYPKLIATTNDDTGGRIMAMSFFAPSLVTADADATVAPFDLTLRGYPTGGGQENTVAHLRLDYTMESAGATATIEASHLEGSTATVLSGSAAETATVSEPSRHRWRVGKRTRTAQFRLVCDDATEELTVRGVELLTRDTGRV
jgi:hypothetical protein